MKPLEDRSFTLYGNEPRDYSFERFPLKSRLLRGVSSMISNAYFLGEAIGIVASNYIGRKIKGFNK